MFRFKFSYLLIINLIISVETNSLLTEKETSKKIHADILLYSDSLDANETKILEVENELKNIEISQSNNFKRMRQISNQIKFNNNKLLKIEQALNDIDLIIKNNEKNLSDIIKNAFKLEQSSSIKLLLNQDDPDRIPRLLKYKKYLLEHHNKNIDHYRSNLKIKSETLNQRKVLLSKLHDEQEKLANENESKKQQKEDRKRAVKELSLIRGKNKKQLEKLKLKYADIKRLTESVSINNSKGMISTSFEDYKGQLPWPAEITKKSKDQLEIQINNIVSRSLILVEPGSKIKAIHRGKVVFSNYVRGYGFLIIIDHGDNFKTLYGHNQELFKKAGETVVSDEIIALSGETGGLSEPGLYFEIRKKGTPENPKIWLKN